MTTIRSRLRPSRIPGGLALVGCAVLLASCSPRERVVFQAQSEFQEVVVTETADGVRSLRFGRDGAVQSRAQIGQPDRLLVPYVRASMVGFAFTEEPSRILVVGLGGGSIPTFLHRQFPVAHVDAVELDPVVVDVARRWFDVCEDERLRLVTSDGRDFLEQVDDPYDVIILDAFGEDSVPRSLTTREFLRAVRHALTPDGAVVANLWGEDYNPQFRSMARTYQDVFEELFVFPVPARGNLIFVALLREWNGTLPNLKAELVDLSLRLGGGLELEQLLEAGDPRATERDFGGEVLFDSGPL